MPKNYVAKKPTNVKEKFINPVQNECSLHALMNSETACPIKVCKEIEETEKNVSYRYINEDQDDE